MNTTDTNQAKPAAIIELEAAYGAPSQVAFGSAVFYDSPPATSDLEQMAVDKYRYFVGDLWERFGEEAWMASWRAVYTRPTGVKKDIISELRAIIYPDAAVSVPMILDNVDNAEKARAALSTVYDDPAMTDLHVYNLSDGGAMSGILLAGYYRESPAAVFLVFILD